MGFLLEAFVRGLPAEGAVGSIVVVVVLPLLESVVEQADVVDDLAFQEPVELLGVDPVRSLDLAVEARSRRFDPDVADALVDEVPVEGLPELVAVVGQVLVIP